MISRITTLTLGVTLVAVATIGAGIVIGPAALAALATQEGAMQAEKPGPEHKLLTAQAGTWDQVIKMRMDPAGKFDESKSVETIKAACGGFWVLTESVGTMMGQPFEGRSQLGYDNFKKKYVGTWIDSFGSYLTTMEGTYDEKSKTLTMMSEMFDPMSGKTVKMKMTTEHVSADESVSKMYVPGPDGKEFVMMEIHGKRRK